MLFNLIFFVYFIFKCKIYILALDAYCLLLVYERLYHVLQDLKLNFEEVVKKTLNPGIKVEKDKKSKEKKKQDTKKEVIEFM